MTICFKFGRYQPPHIEHIYNIIKMLENPECNQVVVGVVGFVKEYGEVLNRENPLGLKKRLELIEKSLCKTKYCNKLSLEGILLKNIFDPIIWIVNRWKKYNDKFEIYTSDIGEFFIYGLFSLLLRFAGINISVRYTKQRTISASKIREMIISGDNNWTKYVPLDELDKKQIYYYVKIIKNMYSDHGEKGSKFLEKRAFIV